MKRLSFVVVILALSFATAFGQTYKVLWSFGGAPGDGSSPVSNLVFDSAGNLYGTSEWGGSATNSQCFGSGCGTIFRLSPNGDGTWSNTLLYSFCSTYSSGACLDGQNPVAGLVLDSAGNLYGTTMNGGEVFCPSTSGCGTVFELSPSTEPGGAWTQAVLHSFCANYVGGQCLDGNYPASHLILDTSGNLFGTTSGGGNGAWLGGTVFELSNIGAWEETVLYNFCAGGAYGHCMDGTGPLAGITFDKAGNLYGTTQVGGTPRGGGGGTVYELTPSSGGWKETTLIGFNPANNGFRTLEGVISFDQAGNLYSTAFNGGSFQLGGVFRFNPATGVKRAFSFAGSNGAHPSAGVLLDPATGEAYGTTTDSGSAGNVFKIGRFGKETVLYQFCQQQNCVDGLAPEASLTLHNGKLYGTTKGGGASNFGVVFEITP